MITFVEVAGLPIGLDLDAERVTYDTEEVVCGCANNVSLHDIIPSLLNKALRYPEQVYVQHSGLVRRQDVDQWPTKYKYDVLFLPSGLLGIEYIKTHIFYLESRKAKAACLVQVFNGELTVVMQKNDCDQDSVEPCVEDARIVTVKVGQKMMIPSGYYYTFVNVGDHPAVFATLTKKEHVVDYHKLRRENGLAYYLIAKNARQELVTNPRYNISVEVRETPAKEVNDEFAYQPDEKLSLYEEGLKLAEIVTELLG